MLRRGVGVGHTRDTQQQRSTMKSMGEQLDAASLSRALDEIELLEKRINLFAKEHQAEIKRDAVLRAQLKMVADSAGFDVSCAPSASGSANTNSIWASLFGVRAADDPAWSGSSAGAAKRRTPEQLADIASRVVEYCAAETRYCGPLVPMARVLRHLNSRSSASGGAAASYTERDVKDSLATLSTFGPAYAVVEPTAAEAAASSEASGAAASTSAAYVCCRAAPVAADVTLLISAVEKRAEANFSPVVALGAPSPNAATDSSSGGGARPVVAPAHRFSARSAGVGRFTSTSTAGSKSSAAAPLETPSWSPNANAGVLSEQAAALAKWTAARAEAALQASVQQADVWYDPVDQRYWFPSAWGGGGGSQ